MENLIYQYDNNPAKLFDSSSPMLKIKRPQDIIRRFQDLAILPNIIGDREYLSRKKTFDIFLKKTDSEYMNLHLKFGKGNNHGNTPLAPAVRKNERKSSISRQSNKVENPLVKKGEGKMLSNELWSENYYRTIVNSSYIREKYEKIVNEVKLRKYETKIKITDEYYKKKHKSFYQRQSVLNDLFKNYEASPTIGGFKFEKNTPVRNAPRSLSEWIPHNHKENFENINNMRESLYGLINTCNKASNMNSNLKKLKLENFALKY